MIEFGEIDPETGEYKTVSRMGPDTIKKCPHLIINPAHYREDGSCRCNDPNHSEMIEWEYTWNEEAKQWQ